VRFEVATTLFNVKTAATLRISTAQISKICDDIIAAITLAQPSSSFLAARLNPWRCLLNGNQPAKPLSG
jgi:hypothetical protein